eukprot:13669198-Heterocapsa_arctica.AAC.1
MEKIQGLIYVGHGGPAHCLNGAQGQLAGKSIQSNNLKIFENKIDTQNEILARTIGGRLEG